MTMAPQGQEAFRLDPLEPSDRKWKPVVNEYAIERIDPCHPRSTINAGVTTTTRWCHCSGLVLIHATMPYLDPSACKFRNIDVTRAKILSHESVFEKKVLGGLNNEDVMQVWGGKNSRLPSPAVSCLMVCKGELDPAFKTSCARLHRCGAKMYTGKWIKGAAFASDYWYPKSGSNKNGKMKHMFDSNEVDDMCMSNEKFDTPSDPPRHQNRAKSNNENTGNPPGGDKLAQGPMYEGCFFLNDYTGDVDEDDGE